MARGFSAQLRYQEDRDAPEQDYDLRVNHPLTIGDTELFLIGHGYAPVVTVRDGNGDIAYSGPTIFLPQGPDMLSFGVVKAPDAKPDQIGLEGLFFPTFVLDEDGDPANLMGDDINPLLSLNVYTGDLGLDSGTSQSVYVLDKNTATPVPGKAGQPLRIDLAPGDTVELPDGLGSVTFEEVVPWQRIQISQTPGQGDRAARRGAGADRADGLAVHPVPPGVGAGRRRRRTARWSRWRPSTGRAAVTWAPYSRTSWRAAVPRPLKEARRDRRRVGHAEQPGRGGGRGRVLPGAARLPAASGRRCASRPRSLASGQLRRGRSPSTPARRRTDARGPGRPARPGRVSRSPPSAPASSWSRWSPAG